MHLFDRHQPACSEPLDVEAAAAAVDASSDRQKQRGAENGGEVYARTTTHAGNTCGGARHVSFSVRSLVAWWAWKRYASSMALLKAADGSDGAAYREFSLASAGASRAPYITATFTSTPSVSDLDVSPETGTHVESLQPTFSATYSNGDGSDGYVQFQVLDSSGSVVASGSGNTVGSGGTSSWTPSANLQIGANDTFEAQAVSNEGKSSSWSAPQSFTVDPRLGFGDHSWFTYITVPMGSWLTAKVNVANGELTLEQKGFSLPGIGLPLNLNFTHTNFQPGESADPGRFAQDWIDSFSPSLNQNSDGSVTYTDSSGMSAAFTPAGGNNYNSPGNVNGKLTGNSSSGWTLTFNTAGDDFAQGQKDTFNYAGQLTQETSATGESININYNASGNPSSVTDTEGRTIDFNYTSGQLTSVTDTAPSNNRSYTFSYNGNLLSSITDPGNGTAKFTYDSNHNDDLASVTSPGGEQTNLGYDSSDRVTSLEQVGANGNNPTWSFSYGSGSTSVQDPDANTTTYDWDKADRVTKTTDPEGQTRSTSWTTDDNVQSVTAADGGITNFTWNETTDVLEKASLPTGASTTYTYGDNSNPYVPTQVQDPQGNSVSYSYDNGDQITSATNQRSSQNSESVTYQGENSENCNAPDKGLVCSITTPNGNTWNYGYNSKGELTTINPPSPMGSTNFTYTADGEVSSQTDGDSNTTNYTWNQMAELTEAAFADDSSISWTYDPDGNLTGRSGGNGSESFDYNSLGRLGMSTDNSQSTTYLYNGDGDLLTLAGPGGTTNYTYTQVNEPKTVQDPWGGTTKYSYISNNDQEISSIAFPNTVTESFGYDKSHRITSIQATNGSNATLLSQSFSYTDPNNNNSDSSLIWRMTDPSGTTTYNYNAVNWLTSANQPSGNDSWSYDGDGNLTSKTLEGTTTNYSYNNDDELTSQNATYDGAGNLTGGTGFSQLSYDAAGRTTSITPSGGSEQSLTYASSNQDLPRTLGGTTFTYNALGIDSSATASNTVYYLRDPSGGLLGEYVNGSAYYYVLDNQGSVADLTDSNGNAADTYTYGPYGGTASSTGNLPNLFGYDSGANVPGTDLIHYGARYYDPNTSRWTQPDPEGSPGQLYPFAGDNPINRTDPTGESVQSVLCTVLVTIACASSTVAETVNPEQNSLEDYGAVPELIQSGETAAEDYLEGIANIAEELWP